MKTTKLTYVLRATIVLLLSYNFMFGSLNAQHNYAEVLQKSLFFYEAQQAGDLPEWNRVSWRGDAGLTDGADVGIDLTGGWFDAGDHMKFGFPMAYSVTTLCWGYLENKDAYVQFGQDEIFKNNIKWVTDYFLKCHTAPNEFWGQVAGGIDHSYWVPAEVVDVRYFREAFKIDANNPGSELACETAAAMAAAAMVFADSDPGYSQTLIEHALQLYNFGDTYRGNYHESIPEAAAYYKSWSGYQDELVWGAIWLYKATGNQAWLNRAKSEYNFLGNETQEPVKSYGWTLAWDDKSYGCYVLMAQLTGEQEYFQDAERHLNEWVFAINPTGKGPSFTPNGLPVLDGWGTNRYASNSAFLMFEFSDVHPDAAKKELYYNEAKRQLDYMLGDNPQNVSYVIGYGNNYPLNPHHRTAHGSWARSESVPVETRHVLYGALVGGHRSPDDFDWVDDRGDYVRNEVATDYNSLFTGCIARLAADFGGSIDNSFPIPETPDTEFSNAARLNSNGSTFTEVAVWSQNKSAFPARIPRLAFSYFVDLTETFAAGLTLNDIQITSRGMSGISVSGINAWDAEKNIYYVTVTYDEGVLIYPGGQGEYQEETQLRIGLGHQAPPSAWDPTNDPSFQGLSNSLILTENIPLYGDGELVWGKLPDGGDTPIAVIEANPTNGLAPLTVSFDASQSSDPNGDVLTYAWDFGDGNSATGVSVQNTYGIGTFTAVLTVTDPDGNVDSDELVITVDDPDNAPVAVASATPEDGKVDLEVTLDGSLSYDPDGDDLSYTWTLGNTVISTDAVVVYTFTEVGTFTPMLTVEANGKSNATTVTVITYDRFVPPMVSIESPEDGASFEIDETISVTATSDDIDGAIVSMELLVNGSSFATSSGASFAADLTLGVAGSYTITTVATDNDGLTATTDIEISVVKPIDCGFGTPLATALPTTHHRQYTNVFVVGDGGPTFNNINNFTINWDLPNNGLWQFSYLSTDGNPDWYTDLRSSLTHTFNQTQPDAILSGTGIPGFDGEYWVALINGEDFAMVEKSGAYTIYFSLSGNAPNCDAKAARYESISEIRTYPSPFDATLNIEVGSLLEDLISVQIFNTMGQMVYNVSKSEFKENMSLNLDVPAGQYIINIKTHKNSITQSIIKN